MSSREILEIFDDEAFKDDRKLTEFTPQTPENALKKQDFKSTLKNQLSSVKKSKATEHYRPRSSKSSIKNAKTHNDIESINREVSNQVIRSVYKLISSKFSSPLPKGQLSKKDQEEIQEFFLKKKIEFQNSLKEIAEMNKKNKKALKNYKIQTKFEENDIQKRFENEILLLKKKNKEVQKELMNKANEKLAKQKKLMKKIKEIELRHKKQEEKRVQEYEKKMIIENIENFYRDRIFIIKECIAKEGEIKKIIAYDEKKLEFARLQEKKQKKLQNYLNLKNSYDQKLEELKQRFSLI